MNTNDNVREVPAFDLKSINGAIEALAKAQARTVEQVGKVLVMAVYASIVGVVVGKEKDGTDKREYASVANSLLRILRTSMKRDAIIAFLQHYGKLAFIPGGKGEFQHFDVEGTAAHDLAWTPEYVETVKLAANNWESFKKPAVVNELDVEARVQDLISAVAKAQKNHKPVKNADLVVDLTSALAAFHAKHANDEKATA